MDEQRWQGGILRLFRSLRGLDAREVAERIGVGAWMLSRWETGQSKPDWEELRALAQVYGVAAETLMDAMDYQGTTLAAGLRDAYREQAAVESPATTLSSSESPHPLPGWRHEANGDSDRSRSRRTRGFPRLPSKALATMSRLTATGAAQRRPASEYGTV